MGKDCGGCPTGNQKQMQEQVKKMEEMMKKRVKPQDCPYLKSCQSKMMKEEWEIMCRDQEKIQEAMMAHAQQKHLWQMCRIYQELEREAKGKIPSQWS